MSVSTTASGGSTSARAVDPIRSTNSADASRCSLLEPAALRQRALGDLGADVAAEQVGEPLPLPQAGDHLVHAALEQPTSPPSSTGDRDVEVAGAHAVERHRGSPRADRRPHARRVIGDERAGDQPRDRQGDHRAARCRRAAVARLAENGRTARRDEQDAGAERPAQQQAGAHARAPSVRSSSPSASACANTGRMARSTSRKAIVQLTRPPMRMRDRRASRSGSASWPDGIDDDGEEHRRHDPGGEREAGQDERQAQGAVALLGRWAALLLDPAEWRCAARSQQTSPHSGNASGREGDERAAMSRRARAGLVGVSAGARNTGT